MHPPTIQALPSCSRRKCGSRKKNVKKGATRHHCEVEEGERGEGDGMGGGGGSKQKQEHFTVKRMVRYLEHFDKRKQQQQSTPGKKTGGVGGSGCEGVGWGERGKEGGRGGEGGCARGAFIFWEREEGYLRVPTRLTNGLPTNLPGFSLCPFVFFFGCVTIRLHY